MRCVVVLIEFAKPILVLFLGVVDSGIPRKFLNLFGEIINKGLKFVGEVANVVPLLGFHVVSF